MLPILFMESSSEKKNPMSIPEAAMPTREDVKTWICQDVAHFLVQQGLQDCAAIAQRFNIDGARFLALSHMDLHKFPVNCQPQIFKLSQDINKLDPKGKWKVVAELTKRFQVSPTDMWQTGKEKMTRLVKTEPPTPPPPDYKQDLPYEEPYKSEACIYDDCITQAGQHQASHKESSTQDSSSDSDMDYIIPNGASANLGNLPHAKGSPKQRKPKPVEHMNAFDYENEEDISPQNTVAVTRGILKSVRATLISRGDSTSRAETPPSTVPRPSHLQSSHSISSCGPSPMKNSVQGEKDLPKETPGKELRSRRCLYGAIPKSNSESQSGHGRGQLPQLPVASSSRPLPDAPGTAQPRAFIPLPLPPLSNFSAGLRPVLDSVGGSDAVKGAPRNFTAPRLITAAGAPTPSSSSFSHSDAGMGGCKLSATLPWPTAADSASSSFNDLQSRKWYAGKCDSGLAKKVVKSYNKDGAFLVRQSSGDRVTQPYTLVVHYGGSIYNLRLYWDPVSTKFYLSKEHSFMTVVDLVEHYKQKPLYLKTESSSATQLASTWLRYPVCI
uniref:B-cell linker protein-like isoform X7 n=1 Tax=Petromyzon marinus TaxID=7757 RepID=A0AAJ7T0C1_PETMA|nr:B-cell linker protein-like isoform X7 [Petromyzon marinus]